MTAFLDKYSARLLGAALCALLAGILAWMAIGEFRMTIKEAVETAQAERDAHWTAEVAKANTTAANNIISQMKASQAAEVNAQAKINQLTVRLNELEEANETLSDTACSGIDRSRARLLNNQLLGE